MNWINLIELALIHERVIQETGGVHGITNPGGLESSLARPFTAFGKVELFPNLISKIAALIHSLVVFHPFADGNKRTALVAADVCLRLNGYRLVPSPDVEPFFWSVVRKRLKRLRFGLGIIWKFGLKSSLNCNTYSFKFV